MINKDRIVPVMATDLLTLYGNILVIAGETIDAVEATAPGLFSVDDATNKLLCAEPVVALDFTEDVSAATVYFIAANNFEGFTIDGAAATVTGDIEADGSTLYKAVLATGAITVTKVGF